MAISKVELKDYPKSIFFEETKIILKQMKSCIYKINIDDKRGTGFFTKIRINNQLIPVFITNYHVLNIE